MNILLIVVAFLGSLIVLYIILAMIVFGRHYRRKTDKLFSEAIKSVLKNSDFNMQDDTKSEISIKDLSENNSNFKYLKGMGTEGEARHG